MILDKATTVAFAGYKINNIRKSNPNPDIVRLLGEPLDATIEELYTRGYRTFLSGMDAGFDLLAAEAVVRARLRHDDVNLVAVSPFRAQAKEYNPEELSRYAAASEAAVEHIYISDEYTDNYLFIQRNDFLLTHSSVLVCYYDGRGGGAYYTVTRATEMGHQIVNLCI